jgi:hypothetical protein
MDIRTRIKCLLQHLAHACFFYTSLLDGTRKWIAVRNQAALTLALDTPYPINE